MTGAPERIWAWVDCDGNWDGTWLADSQTLQPERLPDAEYIRADLAKPKVKPLVWGRAERNGMTEQADCPNGRYYIAERGEYGWLWFRPNFPTNMGRASTLDAAKAAAQADYDRRILEALE